MSNDIKKSLDTIPGPRKKIKYKIPRLTPRQKRILLLEEQAKQERQKLAEIKAQLEPIRSRARKREAAARKLSEVIKGEYRTTSKDTTIVTQGELSTIPLSIASQVIKDDVNIVFQPNPGPQTDFLASTEKEVFFGGARGGAKQIDLNTILPTPTGFSTMGEIKVGEYILSPNGNPVKVIHKSKIDYAPVSYKVEFNTGEIFLADKDHNWFTLTSKERKNNSKLCEAFRENRKLLRPSRAKKVSKEPRVSETISKLNSERVHVYKEPTLGSVKTTKELFDTLYDGKEINHSIAVTSPIEYVEKALPITPYLFGLWLGDGYSSCGKIGMEEGDMNEALSYLNEEILSAKVIIENRNLPFKTVTFTNLTTRLRELGVKDNKHIPLVYLRSSIEQRKELLRGILDTDGTCDKRGQITLTFKSDKLMEGTFDLISGLGIKTRITQRESYIGDKCYGLYNIVKFLSPFPVFKLKRKLQRQKLDGLRPTVFRRFITNITPCAPVPMQCLTVSSADGLYLIGKSYITTHNTYSLLVDPLRYCHREAARALILRRTMPELRDIINHTLRLYPKAYPGAKFREQEKEWRFPSGARIEFGYAENETDALRYQGQAYTYVGVDELPQFPSADVWNLLKGSLRSIDKEIPTFMRACVDEGDVLTIDGWKPIQNIKRDDQVYSLDSADKIVIKRVTDIFEYDIDEELVRLKMKGLYLSMTQDHKIVHAVSLKNRNLKISRWNDIENKRINLYRTGISYKKTGIEYKILGLSPELYLEILGYFLSEGCTTTRNRVIISQIKADSRAIIKEALNETNLNWREDRTGFTLHGNLDWYNHLKVFGKSKDKFIPRYILNDASEAQLNILLNALILGDGHRSGFDYIEYYTISPQLWDDVAELAFKCCYKVWQNKRERPDLSKNTQYSLSIRQNNTPTTEVVKSNAKLELFKGKVYCISVEETHNFVLRQKGGVWISGNTGNP